MWRWIVVLAVWGGSVAQSADRFIVRERAPAPIVRSPPPCPSPLRAGYLGDSRSLGVRCRWLTSVRMIVLAIMALMGRGRTRDGHARTVIRARVSAPGGARRWQCPDGYLLRRCLPICGPNRQADYRPRGRGRGYQNGAPVRVRSGIFERPSLDRVPRGPRAEQVGRCTMGSSAGGRGTPSGPLFWVHRLIHEEPNRKS